MNKKCVECNNLWKKLYEMNEKLNKEIDNYYNYKNKYWHLQQKLKYIEEIKYFISKKEYNDNLIFINKIKELKKIIKELGESNGIK